MADMTKKVIITWVSDADSGYYELDDERTAWRLERYLEGLTDMELTHISPGVWETHWLDQQSAELYISKVLELAAKYNKTVLATEIDDFTPPQ